MSLQKNEHLEIFENIKSYWFKSCGHLSEGVDFAYWKSFSGEGSAPAACAAGLFGPI